MTETYNDILKNHPTSKPNESRIAHREGLAIGDFDGVQKAARLTVKVLDTSTIRLAYATYHPTHMMLGPISIR